MLLISEDSNVEASNRTHLTEKNFFYSIATKEIHTRTRGGCMGLITGEGSLQKSFRSSLFRSVHWAGRTDIFLATGVLNLLFKTSLSQKLELCVLECPFPLSRRNGDPETTP